MAGFFANQAAAYLPGYGKFLPVVAVIGTYLAANASEGATDFAAEAITEGLFLAIDGAQVIQEWLGISMPVDLTENAYGDAVYVEDVFGTGYGGWRPAHWSDGNWYDHVMV